MSKLHGFRRITKKKITEPVGGRAILIYMFNAEGKPEAVATGSNVGKNHCGNSRETRGWCSGIQTTGLKTETSSPCQTIFLARREQESNTVLIKIGLSGA